MLKKLTQSLVGYAAFEYAGNINRFMNVAAKQGLILWDFRKRNEKLYAKIKPRNYKRLMAVRRRCGGRLCCREKAGFPFYIGKLWRRKGLLVGSVLGIFLFIFLNQFVWNVEVNGNEQLSDRYILSLVDKFGIYEGGRKNLFHPPEAALKIAGATSEISWVSVNTNGCTVTVEVKEIEKKPKIVSDELPSDMIAAREGKIVSLEAETGMRQVNIGDTVLKGQTLISGMYQEDISEYTEKKVPIKTFIVHSRGSVRAETVREFETEIPLKITEEYVVSEHENAYLNFLFFRIPLGIHLKQDKEHRKYVNTKNIEIFGKKVPAGLVYEKYVFVGERQKVLEKKAAKKEALRALRALQNKLLPEDSIIMEEKITYTIEKGKCIIKARCRCEEEIGVQKEIDYINFTEDIPIETMEEG